MEEQELTIDRVLEHYGADLSRVRYPDRWSKIKCPFHDDTVASASVNLDKGAFACHACDMRGDAITVIMRWEKLNRREAIVRAEEILGGSIKVVSPAANGTRKPRQKKRNDAWRSKLFG